MFKNNEKFIITGASGWVGKNFLHELQKFYPPNVFNQNVIAFGSKKQMIESSFYTKEDTIRIPIYPISELKKKISFSNNYKLVHCAFLTREKVEKVGLANYIKTNREITNKVKEFILSTENVNPVIISSGAVYKFLSREKNKNLDEDPYAYLKFEEEKIIKDISDPLILRIYGLTGPFIRDPNIFAFGNFLLSAAAKKQITIHSKKEVLRSYGFGSDIAKLGLKWLENIDYQDAEVVNAASHTLSLYELANKISAIFNLKSVKHEINYDISADKYTCDTNNFKNMLEIQRIKLTSLSNQILETYEYLIHNYLY